MYNKEKANEISKEWYKNNKEKRKEYIKEYHKKNPEYSKEHSRIWRKNNLEKANEYQKIWKKNWTKNHPEEAKEQNNRWAKNHPEEAKERYRNYKKNNPEKVKKSSRIQHLKKSYGISLDDYNKLLEKQYNKCAICHKYINKEKQLVVDHNHQTGKVRGLLCHNCNNGLGHMKDNIDILKNAIEYLSHT